MGAYGLSGCRRPAWYCSVLFGALPVIVKREDIEQPGLASKRRRLAAAPHTLHPALAAYPRT